MIFCSVRPLAFSDISKVAAEVSAMAAVFAVSAEVLQFVMVSGVKRRLWGVVFKAIDSLPGILISTLLPAKFI
jgi:hypothetical protein